VTDERRILKIAVIN